MTEPDEEGFKEWMQGYRESFKGKPGSQIPGVSEIALAAYKAGWHQGWKDAPSDDY